MPRDVPRKTPRLIGALTALFLTLAGLPARAADADAQARGAYLASAAGCDGCHTDAEHRGRPYAGGRGFGTPFGTVFAPNITPDQLTGIGRWGLADFTRALRWGIAPDDSHYLPIFPFLFYNRLRDDDLEDLKAFLQTVPAVTRVNPPGNTSILTTARTRAAITIAAERMPGPRQSDPMKGAVWNRGAYLVTTVGRCGDCHTPRNWLGALKFERALSGTSVGPGGKAVPNITPDRETGIGKWSEDEIISLLKDGQTPDFDFVGGAMAEIVKNTSRLDDTDRRAIAVYLRSMPAIRSQQRGAH